VFSVQGADSSGAVDFAYGGLTAGTHTLTARVTDPDGLFVERTRTLRVNTPPSTPIVVIAPSAPATDALLTASVTTASTDADGDAVTVAWTWLKDGVATAFTGPTVPATATTKGETWTARATPSDGTHAGTPGEASVVIANTAPDVTSVSVTPASAPVGAAVTCAATASDPDETAAVTYGWTVNGASVATGATYVLGASGEGRGAAVVCTATARDGDGATDVGAASVTVLNTPPTLASVALAPLDPVAGDSVTCTASGALDADDDAVTVAYAWTRNGQPAGSGDTYSGPLQSGDVLSCTATPNDGAANGTPLSASVSVDNTAPDLFGPVVTPSSAAVGAVLTCAATATDVDGSNPVVTYRWSKDGQPVGTGATYTVAASDAPGATLTCTATADDGEGGVVTGTAAATVENTAPVVASVVLTPGTVRTNDTLTAVASGSDANGQALTWTYAFSVDGVVVQSGSSTTLDGAVFFDKGEVVTVTAVASDGSLQDAATSAGVTVLNTAPTVPENAISPSEPVEGDALTCTVVTPSTDADGDAITYTYAWEVDGAATAFTTATVPSGQTAEGEVWACVSVASDGTALSSTDRAEVVIGTACDDDGDGYRSDTVACGGDDCDDADADVHPFAGDHHDDGVDGDCDGLDCESAFTSGVHYVVCPVPMSRADASSFCVESGFDGLASVFGADEQVVVAGLLDAIEVRNPAGYRECWLSLNDGVSEGTYLWGDGRGLTYANWTIGNPGPFTLSEDCVMMSDGVSYQWHDVQCGLPLYWPACEFRSAWLGDSDRDGSLDGVDCDDGDSSVFPGAVENCDAVDADCDGSVADDFADFDGDDLPDCIDAPVAGDGLAHPTLGTLRYIPAGSFTMGCVAGRDDVAGSCHPNELPAHEVSLTTPVWAMETEFTQGMWADLGYTNPAYFAGSELPVETVTWWEAVETANAMSVRDGLAVCYLVTGCESEIGAGRICVSVSLASTSGHPKDCEGWRLPTEAEWEYAARSGGDLLYAGAAMVDSVGWYAGNSDGMTHAPCTRQRSEFGLCDMTGNVWEWTGDWDDSYAVGSQMNPTGPETGSYRVNRGGGWYTPAVSARNSFRGRDIPEYKAYNVGFRLVRTAW
jgi:formylglycine-generating enzyme required for sulfatase activity